MRFKAFYTNDQGETISETTGNDQEKTFLEAGYAEETVKGDQDGMGIPQH